MNQAQKNTLSSLTGFPVKNSNALQGLNSGAREGKPAEREQQAYTPQVIVDVCLEVWPEGIALDPCSGPDSIVPAAERWFGHKVPAPTKANPGRMVWDGPGKSTPWVPRTYANSPYDTLEDWLAWSLLQPPERIQLAPVRTLRDWWRVWASFQTKVAWLDPLTFVGYEGSFPQGLVLGYRGERGDVFEHAVESRDLGDVSVFVL